jgi:hypothetical protein
MRIMAYMQEQQHLQQKKWYILYICYVYVYVYVFKGNILIYLSNMGKYLTLYVSCMYFLRRYTSIQ